MKDKIEIYFALNNAFNRLIFLPIYHSGIYFDDIIKLFLGMTNILEA